jgi:hypothetical protein
VNWNYAAVLPFENLWADAPSPDGSSDKEKASTIAYNTIQG